MNGYDIEKTLASIKLKVVTSNEGGKECIQASIFMLSTPNLTHQVKVKI